MEHYRPLLLRWCDDAMGTHLDVVLEVGLRVLLDEQHELCESQHALRAT